MRQYLLCNALLKTEEEDDDDEEKVSERENRNEECSCSYVRNLTKLFLVLHDAGSNW